MTIQSEKQLSLFPEQKRACSNAMIRGALFPAIQGKDRQHLDKQVITSQNGIEIKFTGWQLNQDDHDVLMQIVFLASRPFGESITIPANAILAGLGRGKGKSQHEQLKQEIERLTLAGVQIRANGVYYVGHLVDSAVQDERLPQEKRHWTIRLTKELKGLFEPDQFTLIDWEKRKTLKRKDLARWLQLYFDSNTPQYPISVEWLRDKSGSTTKELWKFRQNLKKSLNDLMEAEFITAWHIDEIDLVHIEKIYSKSQQRHVSKGEVVVSLPAPTSREKHLEAKTIEQFRRLYPRFDPYACKGDFDVFLMDKEAPKTYDGAFIGFAKKWVAGKF